MDERMKIFQIWAPDNSVWSPWVKPVLFSNFNKKTSSEEPEVENVVDKGKRQPLLKTADYGSAFIVDLKGDKSIDKAMELAKIGYRPIPLYNCCPAPKRGVNEVIDTSAITASLFGKAEELAGTKLPDMAPPAFLLDSYRMRFNLKRIEKSTVNEEYDNRWCVFPQDFPSAVFLLKQGINKVYLYRDRENDDLDHVLYRYQQKGITILLHRGQEGFKEYRVGKPYKQLGLSYRVAESLGLRLNSTGGFGQISVSGSGYSGYRGG